MNLFEFSEICRDQLGVIRYLQGEHILHSKVDCAPCQHPYTLVKDKVKVSSYFWRCPKCKKKQSLTKDSFLEGAKISPAKLVFLVFYWSSKIAVTTAKEHLDMSSATGVDYYQYMRDICSNKLVRSPMQLGGPGKEVQIDESLLVRAKYRRGRNVRRKQQWIFGAYDVAEKVGYVTYVEKRDAATLLPSIQRVISPGSIIVSDQWQAYSDIPNLPGNYTHYTVNHSQNFVDPVTGKHTNHVESYWIRMKSNGTYKDF